VIAGIPILVRDPDAYLARSLLALNDARRSIVATIDEIERIPRESHLAFRRALTERAAAAQRENVALLDRIRAPLVGHTSAVGRGTTATRRLAERAVARCARAMGRRIPPAVTASSTTGYGFEPALAYLRTDWAGTDAGEEQIAALNGAVEESVLRYCGASPGRALYLGAGLGRHAFDGARLFSTVLAVELSFAAAGLLAAVLEGPVHFSTQSWRGATSAVDVVQFHDAAFPEHLRGSRCDYVASDALALPVADASVDAVVSIFFTDVIPASKLLPEVRRVLRPGGHFVSVGPLDYHFKERAERLTREELRGMMTRTYGLDIEPADRSFDLAYMDDPGAARTVFRVWSFVATARH